MEQLNYHIDFVQHSKLPHDQLIAICSIKAIAWPYSIESQLKWIKENIGENDIHVMLYQKNELIAYMNLVWIEMFVNANKISGFGIGNVCAKEKGKRYGERLMNGAKKFIIESKKMALLFCNQKLVDFYSRYGCKLIANKNVRLSFDDASIKIMIFNNNFPVNEIEYYGRVF